MNYSHPSITVTEPAPGHFVIRGHNPQMTFIKGSGYLVPPDEVYISPEVPTEVLLAILEARGDYPPLLTIGGDDGEKRELGPVQPVQHSGRGKRARKSKPKPSPIETQEPAEAQGGEEEDFK